MVGLRNKTRLVKGLRTFNTVLPSILTLLSFSGSRVSGSHNAIGMTAVIPMTPKAHCI